MPPSIGELLKDAEIEWPPGANRHFIPIDVLEDLITISVVTAELRSFYPDMDARKAAEYTHQILTTAKKLFAILLYVDKGRSICEFLEESIGDDALPFLRAYCRCSSTTQNNKSQQFVLCVASHKYCTKTVHENCGIKAMSNWSRTIKVFDRDQWLVQAPIFERNPSNPAEIPHLDLEDNTVLPYIEDHEGMNDGESGGYSHVWGVRMHSAHQKVYKSTDSRIVEPLLAIKRLFSRDPLDFKKEKDMLSTLSVRNHAHLIKLLATYSYKKNYHFVFPFANTNLRGYWDDTGIPHQNRDTYQWFLQQVCGLTSGLYAIHNFKTTHNSEVQHPTHQSGGSGGGLQVALSFENESRYGRHGDIKPENILWSNELREGEKYGILQIADMGLGRFHRFQSRSNQDPKKVCGSPTYAPPEIALGKPVSRAYDMWSLGCVLLEFITWLLEGKSEVYAFTSARESTALDGVIDDTFFSMVITEEGLKSAKIRQGVTEWFEKLYTSPQCSPMVHDVLKIVQNRLLVIDSQGRIRAEDLINELHRVSQKAAGSADYLLGKFAPTLHSGLGVKLPHGPKTRYAPSSTLTIGEGQNVHDAPLLDTAMSDIVVPSISVYHSSDIPSNNILTSTPLTSLPSNIPPTTNLISDGANSRVSIPKKYKST